MTTIKIGELVFDTTIYPRSNVDAHHINDLALSISNGAEMPPIVVEQTTNRVVDGFHRGKAFRKVFGDDHEIQVVAKRFRDEAAIIKEAGRLNAMHGKRMDSHDKTHYLLMARKAGISDSDIAQILQVSDDYIGKLTVSRVANSRQLDAPSLTGKLQVPLKASITHMAGKTLTHRQEEANDKLSGMKQVFHANQLITLIESGLLNKDDEKLLEALRKLNTLLDEVLATV